MESQPTIINIKGESFAVVKETRLLPGMVLKSRERDVFARLGSKVTALEEQIHTVSLHERGFPVARVLESGEYTNDEWYFIEESLGNEPFHTQFMREYEQDGEVSSATFQRYLNVLERYVTAQFSPANRTDISADDFIATVIPDNKIISNYEACGGDSVAYHEAVTAATERLSGAPMGVLQFDLNPYNVLDRGMIDFELVGYGPLGYDSLLVSLWHRWFTNDPTSRYHIAYQLTPEQIKQATALVTTAAHNTGVTDPSTYMQEFLLIKTAWGFTSEKSITDEPASKQAFYQYRAALLANAVESYRSNKPIDVLHFPDVQPLPDEASSTPPIRHIQ